MIGYLIVGAAAAVDGFALGVIAGRKWGSKLTVAAIKADGAGAEKKVEQAQKQAAPVVAEVKADVAKAETVAAPVLSEAEAWLKQHNAAATK